MKTKKSIQTIIELIDSGEKSIKNAKRLLKDIINENGLELDKEVHFDTSQLNTYSSENSKIIEGVFTGYDMLGVDGKNYPVPANYASKSKLVQGDKLKLTIEGNGKMLYKQIEPIERELKIGVLVKEKDKYQVMCEGKTYDVLTACVTHFKCEVGDKLSIYLPKGKEASFAAIEAKIDQD